MDRVYITPRMVEMRGTYGFIYISLMHLDPLLQVVINRVRVGKPRRLQGRNNLWS